MRIKTTPEYSGMSTTKKFQQSNTIPDDLMVVSKKKTKTLEDTREVIKFLKVL